MRSFRAIPRAAFRLRGEGETSLPNEPEGGARIGLMLRSEVQSELRDLALEVGFDYAGLAPLEPSRNGEAFTRWVESGDHASMAYMERRREERLDPRQLIADARSVICVAMSYCPGPELEEAESGDLWPHVARYARGEDYHEVMKRRLEELADRIESRYPGLALRSYVDTGPVLERELASKAGLGAIGKNTNLLHPEAGSWLLLGELFLSGAVEAPAPVADLCGSCTRCLEACPTGALPEPYRLDSRRCISYWTIEHRASIPREVRSTLESWVFGCDVCQEVCPLNEGAPASSHLEYALPRKRRRLDLIGLLALDRESYLEVFRGSAMKRAKLAGLQRNAAIVMGNAGRRRYVPALVGMLSSPEASLRAASAWSLGRIGGGAAVSALSGRLAVEQCEEVRRELREALARGGHGPGEKAENY